MPTSIIAAVGSALVGGLVNKAINGGSDGADAQQSAAAGNLSQLSQIAGEQWQRYKDNYSPLETQVVGMAKDAGSKEDYERAVGQTTADTRAAFGTMRGAQARESARMGLNPSDGQFTARQDKIGLAEAASLAGNQNRARQAVTADAWTKKMGALGMGQNLVNSAMGGLASAAGGQASMANAAYNRNGNAAGTLGGAIGNAVGNYFKPTPGGLGYGTIDPTQAGFVGPW
jgi:hypothetical protein